LILEADSGHDELRVFRREVFPSDAARTGEWRGTGDVRTLVQPDGAIAGLSIRGYRKYADNRLVLVDLIARSLGAHRDDVIDAVAQLVF
jgi:hypothetical protein